MQESGINNGSLNLRKGPNELTLVNLLLVIFKKARIPPKTKGLNPYLVGSPVGTKSLHDPHISVPQICRKPYSNFGVSGQNIAMVL